MCISCANNKEFYKKEDDNENPDGYYDCFYGVQDGYFLDKDNFEYKKCYKTCKSCQEVGIIEDNKCTGCYDNATLNGTNCYDICKFYHYFDDNKEYFCTPEEKCPDSRNKLVVDTYECVKECTGEDKIEYEDKCWKVCPPGTFHN